MFTVFLRFSNNKAKAGSLMDGHNAWLRKGFDEGIFLLAGSLKPQAGGAIIAHGISREDLEQRVAEDPFVAEDVVIAEINEIAPARTDERLGFLAA